MKEIDDKKAIEVLADLLEKKILSEEEMDAVRSAIGILSWSKLGQSRIKSLKAKKLRDRAGDD